MLGPRAQRQRYTTTVLYPPTDIHSLLVHKHSSTTNPWACVLQLRIVRTPAFIKATNFVLLLEVIAANGIYKIGVLPESGYVRISQLRHSLGTFLGPYCARRSLLLDNLYNNLAPIMFESKLTH
jgi:hypothetical protein